MARLRCSVSRNQRNHCSAIFTSLFQQHRPYATTLFDYVRRAMPWNATKSLTGDELYAVSAYILHLNGVIGADDVLDAQSLPKVKMPNRDGFIPFPR